MNPSKYVFSIILLSINLNLLSWAKMNKDLLDSSISIVFFCFFFEVVTDLEAKLFKFSGSIDP
jgi:hypothetical protein